MISIFPSIDKYIRKGDDVILSNELSKNYIDVPYLMFSQNISVLQAIKMRLPILHKMFGCLYQAKKSASSIINNPQYNGKKTISDIELKDLEKYIISLGIDCIGYTKVTQDLIFKDHKILYENALVFAMEMEEDAIEKAPSKRTLREIFRTYYGLGIAVNKIANYLRAKGYNAMAGPAIGGDVNYVPLAQKAGLGYIGKNGLLITKKFGPSLRLATIYTDIENLPIFEEKNPHAWIKDFCKKCKKCVKKCPAKAIYSVDLQHNISVNQDKCAYPFAKNYGCTICIKECSFFYNNYDKIYNNYL